ncbi:MAG TPA: XisI protein [Nostocaceae cyanobacterium]|nr:XisI protein [Nostocaceae cyanobacterium]
MDTVTLNYRQIIEKVLKEYVDFFSMGEEEVHIGLVLDKKNDRYLIVEVGWQNNYRIYGTLIHLDIINNKVWIQHDGTEEGIANDLVNAGIPKQNIVLAFKPPEIRPYIGFAVS